MRCEAVGFVIVAERRPFAVSIDEISEWSLPALGSMSFYTRPNDVENKSRSSSVHEMKASEELCRLYPP